MTRTQPRRRILVVEDSPTQSAELCWVLEQAGWDVDVAADGLRGVEKARSGDYHLVLSDIVMPGLSGYDLCREIKKDRRTQHLPVILLSHLDEPSHVIQGLESGADNYLTKPWVPEDLVRRVGRVLQRGGARVAGGRAGAPIKISFMGSAFTITRDRRQILEYFASTFEDYTWAKRREMESEVARAAEREQREAAAVLARVARELMASLDVRVTANRFCQLTVEVLRCDRSHVFLRDPESTDYLPVAGHGATPSEWQLMRGLRLSSRELDGLLPFLADGDAIRVGRNGGGSDSTSRIWCGPPGAAVSLFVALSRGKEIAGFHVASYRDPTKSFSSHQERMARQMAEIASLALENSRLHEELDRANRLKSDFVNTMSHELRTPLAVILGYCQLLLSDTFGPLAPEQVEALKRVECNATDLARLVNATLDLSRLKRGCLPVILTTVNVRELFGSLEYEIGARDLHPSLTMRWEIDPELGTLYTDGTRLKAILRNLVDNALKFTDAGSVTISARRGCKGPEFAVSDTGIGIEPNVLPTIFECFRQGHEFLTRAYGGVGLGLYVVRRMVDDLGGQITVESEPGKGSTFRVVLPPETYSPGVEPSVSDNGESR